MSHLPTIVREYLVRFNGETRALLAEIAASRRGVDSAAVCAFATAALQLNTAAAAIAASAEQSAASAAAAAADSRRIMPPVAAAAAVAAVAAAEARAARAALLRA